MTGRRSREPSSQSLELRYRRDAHARRRYQGYLGTVSDPARVDQHAVAALIAAAFGRPPPNRPVASSWPAARANEAVGKAKTAKNKKATFTEVFDMAKLHKNAQP
jgi:hypothetical protein